MRSLIKPLFLAAAVGVAGLVTGPVGLLAKPAKPVGEASMQVFLVRSSAPDCEPNCPEWIAAVGTIDSKSKARFAAALKLVGARKLPVLIDSGGGSVEEALAIGRMVRQRGLDVFVTRTAVSACGPKDRACKADLAKGRVRGVPETAVAKCASACAFVLAGGVRRFVGPRALVGVHQLKHVQRISKVLRQYQVVRRAVPGGGVQEQRVLVSERTLSQKTVHSDASETIYSKVDSYFTEMGIGRQVMALLRATPNGSIRWLSRRELRATAMATEETDGAEVFAPASTSSPPVAAGVSSCAQIAGFPVGCLPGAAATIAPADVSLPAAGGVPTP